MFMTHYSANIVLCSIVVIRSSVYKVYTVSTKKL